MRPAHKVFTGIGGWWGRIEACDWFQERGPYCFKWMANLSFPIQRWRQARPLYAARAPEDTACS